MRMWLAAPVLALTLQSTSALPAKDAIQIAHVGPRHGHEVSVRTGETWNVVYQSHGDYWLVSRPVRVEAREDMLDTGPQKTGKSVSVDLIGDVLFLVRGNGVTGSTPLKLPIADVRRDGKAVLPRDDARQYLKPGEHLDLRLGAARYRLSARGRYDPTRPKYDMLLLDYRLTLTRLSDGRHQTIEVPARFAEDGVPTLIWAGDLDHDGGLDLYMDLTDHYNVTEYTLFLSSYSGPRQLIQKVASKRYVGC